MRRSLTALAVAVLALTLGGCAVPVESKLPEYKIQAEQLREDIAAQLPEGITVGEPYISSEVRFETESGAGDSSDSPAYWRVLDGRNLTGEPGTSEDAATVLGDYLIAEGWSQKEAERTVGRGVTDAYRLEPGWYVEISWATSEDGMAETLDILVLSPTTTRGEKPPANG
ncbi:hypothetical protein R8Z57_08975 [Microbacterium sp. M3]|uniref:Uncharacterized protein n=1 Tax=Microbacterium arthrosphaerae TaxID=792652 RepID=A0ABU4H0P6_9MICO|nr:MULTISPECIES: hypothetical protein [Microbacterium]MDW4572901.1 hypothetical protein [Microbacterium arthrosphaerae]MDW7606756.1 hypothetical protein [Microbacterium sp. M3]